MSTARPTSEVGDVLLFLDPRTRQRPDSTGANQVGVVVAPDRLLFRRGRRIIAADPTRLAGVTNVLRPRHSTPAAAVGAYFEAHRDNYRSFLAGLGALRCENRMLLETGVLMPDRPRYSGEAEFNEAWDRMAQLVEPGDLVLTFNRSSVVSWFIASVDGGRWSHIAAYEGDGMIVEAITAGVARRPLRVYRNSRFHVGLYRHWQASQFNLDKAKAFADSLLGAPYSYRKAAVVGILAILNRPTKNFLTPNGIVYTGEVYLVGQA